VSQQPPVAAWAALPVQFGEQLMMLLPTEEPVASITIGLISLWMEQPGKEDYQG
jgi:hypothetical protein